MQEHHVSILNAEHDPSGSVLKIGTYFVETLTKDLQVGMPTGQPYSTVLMSDPILNLSSLLWT